MQTKEYKPAMSVPFDEGDFPNEHKPTILFVGIYAPTFNSDFMVRGFEKAGYNVVTIDWQKVRLNEQVFGLRERLIGSAMMNQPEFIFLHIQSKGVIDIDTAIALQKIAPVIMYNFDCRQFDEMQWAYALTPHIELNLFSNNEDVQRCRSLGYNNVAVLSSSADYEHYRPARNVDSYRINYPQEIVFIGNRFDKSNMKFDKAAERTEMVEFLQSTYGDNFKGWGMGYSKMVNQQEEVLIYNCTKIAITQNNFYRSRYCSDRVFRAMGSGAMVIQQYYPEINKDFTSGVTSVWVNFEQLKSEIDKYLENEMLRFAKARAGAEYVRERHSWFNRVIELQQILKMNNKQLKQQ